MAKDEGNSVSAKLGGLTELEQEVGIYWQEVGIYWHFDTQFAVSSVRPSRTSATCLGFAATGRCTLAKGGHCHVTHTSECGPLDKMLEAGVIPLRAPNRPPGMGMFIGNLLYLKPTCTLKKKMVKGIFRPQVRK